MAKQSGVSGSRMLQKQLRALPEQIKAGVAAALRDAATRVYNAALADIPADTGLLRRKFRLFQSKDGLRTRVGSWGKRRAAHIHLVEFGTKPHDIKMPDGKVLKHPGAKAQPFLMPAFRRYRVENVKAIREAVVKALSAAAAQKGGA